MNIKNNKDNKDYKEEYFQISISHNINYEDHVYIKTDIIIKKLESLSINEIKKNCKL